MSNVNINSNLNKDDKTHQARSAKERTKKLAHHKQQQQVTNNREDPEQRPQKCQIGHLMLPAEAYSGQQYEFSGSISALSFPWRAVLEGTRTQTVNQRNPGFSSVAGGVADKAAHNFGSGRGSPLAFTQQETPSCDAIFFGPKTPRKGPEIVTSHDIFSL